MIKQSIVVRTDLNMSVGKIAGQVAHASQEWLRDYHMQKFVSLSQQGVYLSEVEREWLLNDRTKIILCATSELELRTLKVKCDTLNIKAFLIQDLGKTEIPAGTFTSIGIGPDTAERIDQVTKGLKLLR